MSVPAETVSGSARVKRVKTPVTKGAGERI